jgi:hypothetical protein
LPDTFPRYDRVSFALVARFVRLSRRALVDWAVPPIKVQKPASVARALGGLAG